jgi:hypothetical protein
MSAPDDPPNNFADSDCDAGLDCDFETDRQEGANTHSARPIERAVRDEWTIPHKLRAAIVTRQIVIATKPQMKVSDAIAATRCLIMMNGQTLAARSASQASQTHFPGNPYGLISTPEQRAFELDSLFDRIESEENSGPNRSPWPPDPSQLADALEELPHAEGTGGGEAA